uniref:Uncharacterized protein n=1 Tax=Equus asinus asinus TaxID=83772 RepID=A0A8C4MQL4_EQUAS
ILGMPGIHGTILHLDYHMVGAIFPDPSGEAYTMIVTFFILALDTLLCLILTLYFERVLPDEDGRRHSPLFFLKTSYWSQHQNTYHEVFENEINPEYLSDGSFEPVSPEFHGKEAIRIRNVKKKFNGKPEKIETLQGNENNFIVLMMFLIKIFFPENKIVVAEN